MFSARERAPRESQTLGRRTKVFCFAGGDCVRKLLPCFLSQATMRVLAVWVKTGAAGAAPGEASSGRGGLARWNARGQPKCRSSQQAVARHRPPRETAIQFHCLHPFIPPRWHTTTGAFLRVIPPASPASSPPRRAARGSKGGNAAPPAAAWSVKRHRISRALYGNKQNRKELLVNITRLYELSNICSQFRAGPPRCTRIGAKRIKKQEMKKKGHRLEFPRAVS